MPTAKSTPLLTATATTAPLIDLPAPLYFLADADNSDSGRLWVLRPGEQKATPVLGPYHHITCFDVSLVDGRLAIGTESGWVYVEPLEGDDPQILINTSITSPYPVSLTGISWSPDGKRLAYTVGFEDSHDAFKKSKYPTAPTGVWVVDLENPKPVWLISNNYLESEESVSEFSVYTEPVWSPDGQAIKVKHGRWDGWTTIWFYPVEPMMVVRNDRLAHEINASWSADSQALLASGFNLSDIGHLTLLSRDGGEARKLIDGTEAGIQFFEPFVLDSGIAFSAYHSDDPTITHMYYGKMEGETFQWQEMDENPLCPENYVQSFAHNTGEEVITLLCGKTSLRLIEPAVNTFREIALTPFMQQIQGAVIQIHWGAD